jgi:HEAT repeat protein
VVTTAPTTFQIKVQNKAEREKTAKTVCDGIAADRKKRIEGLVHVLLNATVQEKVAAAAKLGDLCDPMAVPFLMTRLVAESNRDVRLASVAALGHISDPASARALIALLDDEDVDMATTALNALSVMTEADPPYAFVEGTTIKIRKKVKGAWEKKLSEGFFDKLPK